MHVIILSNLTLTGLFSKHDKGMSEASSGVSGPDSQGRTLKIKVTITNTNSIAQTAEESGEPILVYQRFISNCYSK